MTCGDFNVAHNEIDLKNPDANRGHAGFSDEERGSFSELLEAGFTDSFRHLYPDARDAYSWWSYRMRARARNVGWRIDYFLVCDNAADRIIDAKILSDIPGSDHCPLNWISVCRPARLYAPDLQTDPCSYYCLWMRLHADEERLGWRGDIDTLLIFWQFDTGCDG